jgi:hypothetical protein
VRDNFTGDVDVTLGLRNLGGGVVDCPACGQRYRHEMEPSTYFHDYDMHYYLKLATTRVCRCPACGSTSARADETRSRLEFTFMACDACGESGLVDSWQRDLEWFVDLELPVVNPKPPDRVRCARCADENGETAWKASQARRLSSPVQEPHFGVDLTQCACGQRFAVVFTERVAWAGGEDDQTWLAVPVDAEEQARIEKTPREVEAIARGRRFLLRTRDGIHWRDRGFAIGPHD